jgi:hypothetical protein
MTNWTQYLSDKDTTSFKKKKRVSGCKRNRISKTRNGPCIFNEQEECRFCKRPRRKEYRFDPTTNTVIVHYFE